MKRHKILLSLAVLSFVLLLLFCLYYKSYDSTDKPDEIVLSTLANKHDIKEVFCEITSTPEMVKSDGSLVLSDENFKGYYLSMVVNHGTDFGNILNIKVNDRSAAVYEFVKTFACQSVKYQVPYALYIIDDDNTRQWVKSVRFFPANFVEYSLNISEMNKQQIEKTKAMIVKHQAPMGLTIRIKGKDIANSAWRKLFILIDMLSRFDNKKVQYQVILI